MDLSTAKLFNGRLTQEEKERRRRERLCMYCGQPNHIAVNCPTLQTRHTTLGTPLGLAAATPVPEGTPSAVASQGKAQASH